MEYRKLPKGNKQISVIGFGGSGLHQAGEKEAVETINLALENGINYFDLAVSFFAGDRHFFSFFRRLCLSLFSFYTAAILLLLSHKRSHRQELSYPLSWP